MALYGEGEKVICTLTQVTNIDILCDSGSDEWYNVFGRLVGYALILSNILTMEMEKKFMWKQFDHHSIYLLQHDLYAVYPILYCTLLWIKVSA